VLDEVARQVVLAPAGDLAETERLLDSHGDVAAVIIEPTGASWGQVPTTPDFLVALRKTCTARGVVLIFDEVISGFRCSPGGAQAHFGITPDLTTLAKILAGGLPGGAVAGKKELLDLLSFGAKPKIPHHGTFNANPLSAAAGIATLELIQSTDACQRASNYAARLRAELQRVVVEEGVSWVVYGTFSGFHIFTNPERRSITAAEIEAGLYDYRVLKAPAAAGLLAKLRIGMMTHGVEIFSWPGGPTSAVHADADMEMTIEAFRLTLRALRAERAIE
jgi:glutamate-1-semialdehyde 2,1-aminomutase